MVRDSKYNKDRIIPLAPALARKLNHFIKDMKSNEKVFKLSAPSITMKIKYFARKAGLNDFHTHTIRHKFATDLLERGANIKQVQELLGHENLATTEVYLSITSQGLRDAVNLLDKRPSRQSELDKKDRRRRMRSGKWSRRKGGRKRLN